jgi:hypothetical protein
MLGWRRFVWAFLAIFGGSIALLESFIVLMNPYGNLPHLLFSEHAITDINQRFQYPALIRSGRYDSIVVGASDARLLRPDALDQAFGGRFANLAMNAAQAWEQYRLTDLFLRQVARPRMLLMGLDHVWCDEDAAEGQMTFRGFPEWMYDDNRWNDLGYMLNSTTVETSGRRFFQALGFRPARFPDGYEVFTPPESAYDKVKVRNKLWGPDGPHPIEAEVPAYVASPEERAAWQFPALAWLDEIVGRSSGRVVLAFMPAHIAAQPVPGSANAARLDECKARIADIAKRHQATLIDFEIRSEITANDANYWDRLHYRLPIADRIVNDIDRALATRKDDPNGDWRYLVGPSVAADSSRP